MLIGLHESSVGTSDTRDFTIRPALDWEFREAASLTSVINRGVSYYIAAKAEYAKFSSSLYVYFIPLVSRYSQNIITHTIL